MKVIGTLVVGFGEDAAGASGAISAEWEEIIGADGEVKNQYVPGDVAYLLIHHDDTVTIDAVRMTSGSVSKTGEVVLSRSAEMGFADAADEQSLQYLPAGGLSFDWYGNAGGGAVVDKKNVNLSAGQFPCLAEVSYPVRFIRYQVQTPMMDLAEDETFPLRAYVYYTEEVEA